MASPAGPTFEIEKTLLVRGMACIAGVDEAGRGALAGPLALGMVIFHRAFIETDPPYETLRIDDSKKLTPRQRERACAFIRDHALFAGWTMVSHRIVDRLNVNGATEYALNKILGSLDVKPEAVLMDGNFRFRCAVPVHPVRGGDERSLTIAAASIMAKVHRDAVMEKLDCRFPGYGMDRNKGYGTREHMAALENIGYSPIHRLSYDPVRSMVCGGEHEDRTRR
jgi:ribonuclease HII